MQQMPVISKKLLGKVLGHEIIYNGEMPSSILKDNMQHYYRNGMVEHSINIYELAHKCKEWAFSQGIKLTTYMDDIDKWVCTDKFNIILGGDFLSETEPEAIFQACEWILEQKEKELLLNKKLFNERAG